VTIMTERWRTRERADPNRRWSVTLVARGAASEGSLL